MKKVSIITASFNNQNTIEDTLKSVLAQTYNYIEFIIIDAASTDKTLALINEKRNALENNLQSFKLISEKDDGIASAWNKGLNLATGEIIFFLNSDDWINDDTVDKAVKLMNINKLEIVYGVCSRVNENKKPIFSFQKKFNKYRVIWNFGFSFTTCFCTKKVYDEVGGFDENYKIAVDSDFLLRCVKMRVKFIKGNHEVNMRTGGVSTLHRKKAHEEYKKALIANGYPKFLVALSHFFFKFL